MDLCKEILCRVLKEEKIQISFPELTLSPKELLEIESYKALNEIKTILETDSLSDEVCFMKIEEIVCVFEKLGSTCGSRHDF